MKNKTTPKRAYPQVAFCSAITPPTLEHYLGLKAAGIDTASVCLHLSGYNYYKFATLHTDLARQAGIVTHAYMHTDLYEPLEDVMSFTKRFSALGFTSDSKITVLVNADKYVTDREIKICEIMRILSKYHPEENIDLAFFKQDLDEGLYDLNEVPHMINLTVINCEPKASSSGVEVAGTWIYTSSFNDTIQMLGYDYYGFYTECGYQLSLIDTDYTVQPGDTWRSISTRHGIPMIDLLHLNNAVLEDRIYAGQIIKIA